MEWRYFTKTEAERKVGQKIKTLVAWSGVPVGTTGAVVKAAQRSDWKRLKTHAVMIQWDLSVAPRVVKTLESGGEPLTLIMGGKPLMDAFSKREYDTYLIEVVEE